MLASGALSPLTGFMGRRTTTASSTTCASRAASPWALPVCLAVDDAPKGDRVALADEAGRRSPSLDVEEVYDYDKEREAERCFRTTDDEHPGVARLYAQADRYLAGPVTVFERLEPAFPELHRDPAETRALFAERGWKRVVGFQTRNPIHRAHEYLTKCALETVDGLLIHPLVGETKSDDVPAASASRPTTSLVEGYYPEDRVVVSAFPAAMRYAGPREAIWHAICRKNYGCSHFIVGRDHAGVGQLLRHVRRAADLRRVRAARARHRADVLRALLLVQGVRPDGVARRPARTSGDDHVFLSGTKVREMLANGELPPAEFTRPEVAEVLIEAYAELVGRRTVPASDSRRMTWELSLTGLLIGLLVGMTGMGGGSLMTPVLVLVFDFNVVLAVGTDILHGAIFKTIGAWRHRMLGHVHARLTFWLALGSVPASLGGVYVVEMLKDQLRRGHQRHRGADSRLARSSSAGSPFSRGRSSTAKAGRTGPTCSRTATGSLAVVIGLFGGFILGLTSVGSGTFFGLMMLILFPLTASKIVGTDIFHAAILLWAAGIAHLGGRNVDLSAVAWLSFGSIPGILLGSQLTVRLPDRAIRLALAIVLVLAGVKLTEIVPGF